MALDDNIKLFIIYVALFILRMIIYLKWQGQRIPYQVNYLATLHLYIGLTYQTKKFYAFYKTVTK